MLSLKTCPPWSEFLKLNSSIGVKNHKFAKGLNCVREGCLGCDCQNSTSPWSTPHLAPWMENSTSALKTGHSPYFFSLHPAPCRSVFSDANRIRRFRSPANIKCQRGYCKEVSPQELLQANQGHLGPSIRKGLFCRKQSRAFQLMVFSVCSAVCQMWCCSVKQFLALSIFAVLEHRSLPWLVPWELPGARQLQDVISYSFIQFPAFFSKLPLTWWNSVAAEEKNPGANRLEATKMLYAKWTTTSEGPQAT